MSNNVTRKGLAFGALVALTSSVIAGAPAQAAGELNVVPSAGTSYNTAFGSVFNLKTTFAPGFTPSAYEQLKYLVKTDANATVEYGVGSSAVANPATSQAVSTTSAAIAAGSGSPYSVTATSVNYLGLEATGTAATTSVEVTAFVDANNDGALTAGEWNTVKTVTFKKAADIVPTVTLTAPKTGDQAVSASVNWGDLNIEQITTEAVEFAYNDGSAQSAIAGSFNSSTSLWEVTGITSGLASASTVSAQAKIGSLLGSAVTATATARTVKTVSSAVVAGNDATVGSTATSVATAGGTTNQTTAATGDVRKAGTWTAAATLKDFATTAVAVPGVEVTATVKTSATLSGTAGSVKSIAVGGTTYTSNTANAVFATVKVTTDANGVAAVPVTTVGLAANDTVTVTFSAQNLTSLVTVTAKDVVYTVTDDATAPVIATAKNTAASFAVSVKDQFGVLSAATNQRVKVASTQAGSSIADQYIAVSGGKATFSVTPATDDTDDVAVAVTLEESTVAGNLAVSWASVAGATNLTDTTLNGAANDVRTIKVRAAAYSFSTAPAVAQVTNAAGTTAAYDATSNPSQTITQTALVDLAAPTAANATWATVTLTGSNAGENLTVSGSGVILSIDGAAATADKATKIAQAAAVTVYVASNTVGTKTLTVTNGSVSATVDVKFISVAAAEATAANFAVAVATAAQAGRSIDATVTVTDKWGNPVAGFDATASVAGVASVNGGFSANVTTDANGKATVKLTAGVNDLGDAVVTFSDNDSATSTNVTAVAKTVTFGQTDGYIDVLNGKRASVTWSMAKGKRVAFLLDGVRKYNFVQTGDAELNLQFNLKKGTHNIKLIIGGVIVDDITVKITK